MSRLTKDEIRANRLKWLEALESGAYAQRHGHGLRDDKGAYCCLGVACEVMGGGEWYGDMYKLPDGKIVRPDGECLDGELIRARGGVTDWLGMTDESRWACVHWNDNGDLDLPAPLTFPEIATKMRGRWRLKGAAS